MQVIRLKTRTGKAVHLGRKSPKIDRTYGAGRTYCGTGEISTGTRAVSYWIEQPDSVEVTCKKCAKIDAETRQAEEDKKAEARTERQAKIAAEKAAAEVVEIAEEAPVVTVETGTKVIRDGLKGKVLEVCTRAGVILAAVAFGAAEFVWVKVAELMPL